jgi:hypothetical protein
MHTILELQRRKRQISAINNSTKHWQELCDDLSRQIAVLESKLTESDKLLLKYKRAEQRERARQAIAEQEKRDRARNAGPDRVR